MMKMKAKTIFKGKILSNKILPYFETLANLMDEAELKISQEGIEATNIDQAMISAISFSIPKEDFSVFEFNRKIPFRVGFSTKTFLRILKKAFELTMEMNPSEIWLSFDSSKFKLPILEIERIDKEMKKNLKKLKFKVQSEVYLSDFKKALEYAELIGSETITLEANGTLTLKGETDILKAITKFDSLVKGEGRAVYPLVYLKKLKIKQEVGEPEKITLNFSKDYPLKLEWKNLEFVIAPRIEE